MRPTVWNPFQTFSELVVESDFKLWLFPEKSNSSTNKNGHFFGLQKVTILCDTQRLSQSTYGI